MGYRRIYCSIQPLHQPKQRSTPDFPCCSAKYQSSTDSCNVGGKVTKKCAKFSLLPKWGPQSHTRSKCYFDSIDSFAEPIQCATSHPRRPLSLRSKGMASTREVEGRNLSQRLTVGAEHHSWVEEARPAFTSRLILPKPANRPDPTSAGPNPQAGVVSTSLKRWWSSCIQLGRRALNGLGFRV